jgi:hypothetical protein
MDDEMLTKAFHFIIHHCRIHCFLSRADSNAGRWLDGFRFFLEGSDE